jgi:DNA-directed RNA polymerase subunit K/omega
LVVGETGSGKSTFLDIFMGLLPPTSGSFKVDDKNITDSELIEGENDDLDNCYYQYDNIVYEYEEDKEPTQVLNENRITPKKMTKYELVRVLGIRTKQISVGAKVLIKNIQGETPLEIAIHELINKMTPFIIKRPLPNNTFELWHIKELDIDININDIKNIISF